MFTQILDPAGNLGLTCLVALVPVVLMLLVRFNVLTIPQLKAWRSYFIVAAFAIAAVMEYLGYRMCRKIMSIDI